MKVRLIQIFVFILLILGIIWVMLPYYLRRALIHQHAGIEDYTLFHNRIVKAGNPLPWELHSAYNVTKLNDKVRLQFEHYETAAYLVVLSDSILYEEYWDDLSDSSHSNSFSMAKSFISVLIGCLLDEGKIQSLDQPVSDYIPSFQAKEYSSISIRDLLTMSSGLDWDESYSGAFSKTTMAYYGRNLPALVTSLKPVEAPGRIFRYKSCDTQLLGLIIEKASGMRISQYASLKLWQPMGAEHDALWSLDREDGTEKAYCCFNSNARDFARFGQMVLDSGVSDGKRIVSSEYLHQATSSASWLKNEDGKSCDWYGYHFWKLTYRGLAVTYARGILGQYILVIPEKEMVIVRLGHKRSEPGKNYIPEDIYVYIDAALSLNSGK
jgi:CubicO group peptidase (beta-lactamase class C family)